jgi:hypothetical protein
MLRVGDKIEVKWRVSGKVVWWPAQVLKVSAKQCTLRYEARPPAFKKSSDEVHRIVGDCLVEKDAILPFRRVAEGCCEEVEPPWEEVTTTEEELSSEEEDEEWTSSVEEVSLTDDNEEDSYDEDDSSDETSVEEETSLAVTDDESDDEDSYVDAASGEDDSSDEMSVEEEIVKRDRREWQDIRRRQHYNDQYRSDSGIQILCDIIEECGKSRRHI